MLRHEYTALPVQVGCFPAKKATVMLLYKRTYYSTNIFSEYIHVQAILATNNLIQQFAYLVTFRSLYCAI